MGNILGVYLTPHPPIIVEAVGKGRQKDAQKTIESMQILSREVRNKKPDTIIVISPHGPVFSDGIGIMAEPVLKGDFSQFGASDISMSFYNNDLLIDSIVSEAQRIGILAIGLDEFMCSSYNITESLDWGVLVPLYFINQQYSDYKLVTMGISQLPFHELYSFGIALRRAIAAVDGGVVIIASGDLSHRLKEDGPYGYHPSGEKLDQAIINLIETGDIEGLFNIEPSLIEEGGECGLRSIIMAMGVLDGQVFSPNVLSYEGPFGVGYCVASFEPGELDDSRLLMDKLIKQNDLRVTSIRNKEDTYVRLAREALESYIREGKTIDINEMLPESLLDHRAGIFVTIKQHNQLRGCIGTIEPARKNIAEEIIHNAISAGTRDPRFFPVEENELNSLVYSVDVLQEPEAIESIDQLDVKRYGVIVNSGSKNGLLLPNLEGVNTPKEQVDIALEKAGINEDDSFTMKRFEVIRHQ